MNGHPFRWLPDPIQRRAFWATTLLTLALMAILRVLDRPLQTTQAPQGIVSFELAGSMAKAQEILSSWDASARVYAGLSLGLDYLFMGAYATAIGLGCVLVLRTLHLSGSLARLGTGLAWALLAAAILDATENYALIQLLLGSSQDSWPAVARWCAIPKFAIVVAGLLFIAVGGLAIVWRRLRPRQAAG